MTSLAFSLRSIEGGIASPVVGWAVDKYGARGVITFGAIVSGFGFVAMYLIKSLLSFYLVYGILLSIGMSAMLYLPSNALIAKWFVRRVSLAMSLVAVGAGFGGLIFAPLSAVLIEKIGWRSAFIVLGVFIWVAVIPLTRVLKNSPEEMGLRPDGDPDLKLDGISSDDEYENGDSRTSGDYTLKQALVTRTFWILALAFFFRGMIHSTVIVHAIPALTDGGISTAKAAFILGQLTIVSVIGRLSAGYLGDRIDKRYLLMVAFTLQATGVIFLMNAHDTLTLYLFVVVYAVGFGATVPLSPAIRAEYFGRAAFGKIQGIMTPIIMLSSATGPVLAGYMFDVTGTYKLAFLIIAVMTYFGAFTILFAKPAAAIEEPVRQEI